MSQVRPEFTEVKKNSQTPAWVVEAPQMREGPDYRELYMLDGYSAGHADNVLNVLTIHRPNGYGVMAISELCALANAKPEVVIPVCFGLCDGGSIERLIVRHDHIIFAVRRELDEQVKAIQAQSNEKWATDYDAAEMP